MTSANGKQQARERVECVGGEVRGSSPTAASSVLREDEGLLEAVFRWERGGLALLSLLFSGQAGEDREEVRTVEKESREHLMSPFISIPPAFPFSLWRRFFEFVGELNITH